MILKALYDYSQNIADKLPAKGSEFKEIEYVIIINSSGQFIQFESKRRDKRHCAQYVVAKGVNRTSTPKPNKLWDNGKYVLGIDKSHNTHNELFVSQIKKIAIRHPDDVSINALVKFYETPKDKLLDDMSKDPLYEDVINSLSSNFSFMLEGDNMLIAEKQHLFMDCVDEDDNDEIRYGRCLISGEYAPLVRTTTPTPLPDNSPMAALVSFQVNSGYDSYGKTQAYNAPLSIDMEERMAAALKKLLGKDSKNKARIGKRMFLFWGSGNQELDPQVEDGISLLLDTSNDITNDPDDKILNVINLFKGIFSGKFKTSLDDRFHILGLAPNTGRIAVVLWEDCDLKCFSEKIIHHFSDMEIIDTRKEAKRKPYYGVYSMVSAVTLGGKLSDAQPNLIESVTESVINGKPYPITLYTAALERIRCELNDSSVSVTRAAILKAYINRKTTNSITNKPLHTMLDKTNTNPGYLCGRLSAVLEKIQKDAGSGDSIRTRYMGAASSTPGAVFPAMLNVSVHHSEKLSDGSRIFFEQLKQEIIDKLPVSGFPNHLSLNDQGRFFVGYYHQRADLYTKN